MFLSPLYVNISLLLQVAATKAGFALINKETRKRVSLQTAVLRSSFRKILYNKYNLIVK